MKTPKVLDKMVDTVLRYRPEAKIKVPRERKKNKQLEAGDSSK